MTPREYRLQDEDGLVHGNHIRFMRRPACYRPAEEPWYPVTVAPYDRVLTCMQCMVSEWLLILR